ncbi:uncharacterized protein LOC9645248 [Selaginella moellendorffii]|uniref:uncharacterized protein LOC9645248 n=1 Tax=Selaginella moellendorffii TaxID=88036 RepID=UPI000D1C57F6|nr:uncharacterized protein LOC9645248 [Selaginella moellendorffii]|eukprot:XP_002975530.2 uncharacterized protein LOC9645248 [Selaginella moellendorffii]
MGMDGRLDLLPMYAAMCKRHKIDQNPAIVRALQKQFAAGGDELELEVGDDVGEIEVCCVRDFLKLDLWSALDLKITGDCSKSWKNNTLVSFLTASKDRLRHVDLSACTYRREFVRFLYRVGLSCETLKLGLCSAPTWKFNLAGEFHRLEVLIVDHSRSITLLSSTCFEGMPKLAKLSMCGTGIVNLWTTCRALSKLPSLRELRFQRCVCCEGTGHCIAPPPDDCEGKNISAGSSGDDQEVEKMEIFQKGTDESDYWDSSGDEEEEEEEEEQEEYDELGEEEVVESELDTDLDEQFVYLETVEPEAGNVADEPPKAEERQLSYRFQSTICHEKFYRQFMISSLPKLQVLDNLEITQESRKKAWIVYCDNFERSPNTRRRREGIVEILKSRERGGDRGPHKRRKINETRALSTSKLCDWPATSVVYNPCKSNVDISRRLKPRQFEYHPKDPALMVLGTLNGELAVVNHEEDRLVAYIQASAVQHRVLGLCWWNNEPDKFIAGSDNGVLELYSLSRMRAATMACTYMCGSVHRFNDFEQLTSVHINSQDELFLASGYNKNIGLYDLQTARLVKVFPDLHEDHINVVKFAHHSPKTFATSSFDKTVKMWDLRTTMTSPVYCTTSRSGNVMLCFSHDDHFVLVSAVDNEVRQYLAADGRLHTKFDITLANSRRNYTRSYYMNGRDYIITGSCEENRIGVYSAQTGRRLRDVTLEGRGVNNSLYVQSLRGDPFRDFHMCVLAAYNHPHQRSEIVKINMVASSNYVGPTDSQSSFTGGSVSGA